MGPFIPKTNQPDEAVLELAEGDRVRLVHRYSIEGQHSERWNWIAAVGDTGTVTSVVSLSHDGTISVRWDRPRSADRSRIDASCFVVID